MKYFEQLSSAYLAHFSRRLADLIIEQGSELLTEMGLETPSTAISTVIYLDKDGPTTVAALADALGVSHQMATQRINALEKLKLVARRSSQLDKRAKNVVLTQKGQTEVKKLAPFAKLMSHVFDELEKELGCQLTRIIRRAELSLIETPLKNRLRKTQENNYAIITK